MIYGQPRQAAAYRATPRCRRSPASPLSATRMVADPTSIPPEFGRHALSNSSRLEQRVELSPCVRNPTPAIRPDGRDVAVCLLTPGKSHAYTEPHRLA